MKSITVILITIVSLSFQISFAQFELIDAGTKPVSMGGAFTSLANNSNAVYYNPAGISQVLFREVSIF